MKHIKTFGAVTLAILLAMGCASSTQTALDTARPVTVPGNAELIGFGTPDALVIAPRNGTYYFVDDASGRVVWVISPGEAINASNTTPSILSDGPGPIDRTFSGDRRYRLYFVPAR